MKGARLRFVSALLLIAVAFGFHVTTKTSPSLLPAARAATFYQEDATPCTPPTQMASTPEQTAWQLFVAATCPVNQGKYPYVVWENWIEQSDLYSPTAKALETRAATSKHILHDSPLAAARRSKGSHQSTLTAGGLPQAANTNCNPNTASGRTICEEARINPDAVRYITQTGGGLQRRLVQAKMAASGTAINFTPASVEIKADWIQYPAATCSNPPQGVHVEQIGNFCYALGGIHLISKLAPNWIWATFEPQNLTTNPKRCVDLGCNDPWGSSPAFSQGGSGGNTQLTAQLKSLMTAAKLAPEWFNYRLDGVQMDFTRSGNNQITTATLLGNSIIEGDNVGMPMAQASCITCHSVSSVAANGTDGITLLAAEFNPVGSEQAPPGGPQNCKWIARDFVWSLFLAQPRGPAACTPKTPAAAPKKQK